MKAGRNDPCPCGSGKKYKKCCLEKDAPAPAPIDFAREAVRKAADGLPHRLMQYASRKFRAEALFEAWGDFNGEDGLDFDPEGVHLQVFHPWYLYNWKPIPGDTVMPSGPPFSLGVAGAFLVEKGGILSQMEKSYIQACMDTPFSFHEIVHCVPGQGFLLRDILTGDEADVTERRGSELGRPGLFLFGKVVRVNGVVLLDGCSSYYFEPREKKLVLDLRKDLRKHAGTIDRKAIIDFDLEIRDLYLDLVEERTDPTPPEVQNTDGDPFCFHTIVYDITSPREAFDALKSLAWGVEEPALLNHAAFAVDGSLTKVTFTWSKPGNAMHRHWENTSLGVVAIDGGTLKVEVNSERRADEFKSIAEARLRGIARHRFTETKSVEEGLKEFDRRRAEDEEVDEEREALMENPEVRAKLQVFLARQYEDWADSPLPILDGKTPREAVNDPEGREMVETLLATMERGDEDGDMPPIGPVFAEIRKKLGL